MSPWELAIGQVLGYRPFGPRWRCRVTAIERGGKCLYAVIPTVDGEGKQIRYERPPSGASPIADVENYFIIEQTVQMTDPWLAARLDHEDIKPPPPEGKA